MMMLNRAQLACPALEDVDRRLTADARRLFIRLNAHREPLSPMLATELQALVGAIVDRGREAGKDG